MRTVLFLIAFLLSSPLAADEGATGYDSSSDGGGAGDEGFPSLPLISSDHKKEQASLLMPGVFSRVDRLHHKRCGALVHPKKTACERDFKTLKARIGKLEMAEVPKLLLLPGQKLSSAEDERLARASRSFRALLNSIDRRYPRPK